MAISISRKPFSFPLLAFITIYLTLLHRVHSADTLSFHYERFDRDQKDLIFQGDAAVGSSSNNNAIELTRVDNGGNPEGGSVGRVLYSAPVRLFDRSASMASFETTFTFAISAPSSSTPGDGLAFFMAKPDTTIPSGSGGALLGLFSSANALNNSRNELIGFKASSDRVVAVEFDTYPNTNMGDPDYRHIGIDVNTIKSSAVGKWDWQNGKIVTAHVSYNSASRRLIVVASYPNSNPVTVSHDVELNTVLPEWVRVGFSATTGEHKQTNNLLSWSFRSNLRRNHAVREENCYLKSAM